jgi:hypothetical protein
MQSAGPAVLLEDLLESKTAGRVRVTILAGP